ncbi:MAG TPA: response regulator [Armatimonadota bacterium]|jgi:response regulator NasT
MAKALSVLIADDEPIARLDLREMLESLGHSVVAEASDGDSALRLARELRPHVAILDIRMPGLDGLEVARTLAEERIAPTLILSAYTDQEYIERSKESGCLCYLVKPFRVSDLEPALIMTVALADRLNSLQGELEGLQDALATRKAVERAKGVLMDRHHLKEHEAFRRIQVESMNSRRTMREVAEDMLKAAGAPAK